MLKSKKGAETGGTQVAVILIVIALFMTLYILFISPEERDKLLNINETKNDTSKSSDNTQELLAESPGSLTPTSEAVTVHRIPSIRVFLITEPKIISLAQNLFVANGLFSDSSPKIRFKTENLDETTKTTLFFSVQESSGELRIKVNNNVIYSEEIKTSGAKIVEIAKSYLKEDNTVEFSVSSPGLAFWSTNKYNLNDIGVKQEFERVNKEEVRSFTIPNSEKKNLVNAKLSYLQVCNAPIPDRIASLDIFLNERRVHSAEISCITTEEELELDPDLLLSGTNTIAFRLEEGDFTFNQIKIETELREADRPTYFFSLSQDQFDDIRSGDREITMEVLLESTQKMKNARFLINNNEILMQTDRSVFERDLKDYVIEGTNFIKIIPINSFNMVGLKVTLEE